MRYRIVVEVPDGVRKADIIRIVTDAIETIDGADILEVTMENTPRPGPQPSIVSKRPDPGGKLKKMADGLLAGINDILG